MEGFDFIRMAPANEIVKGGSVYGRSRRQSRAEPGDGAGPGGEGKAYGVYVRGGTRAELMIDLPAGDYKAEWVNTRSGQIEKPEHLSTAGGNAKLASPEYSQDIAVPPVIRQ